MYVCVYACMRAHVQEIPVRHCNLTEAATSLRHSLAKTKPRGLEASLRFETRVFFCTLHFFAPKEMCSIPRGCILII